MKKIRFSHCYDKLEVVGRPDKAMLIAVYNTTKEEMPKPFIEYDTKYMLDDIEHYELPDKTPLLVLIFLTRRWEIFTTIRTNRNEKEKYYRDSIGDVFEIVIGPEI